MNYSFSPEFKKELKSFSKKWRSLGDDIEYAKPRIELLYHGESAVAVEEYRKAFFNNRRATVITKFDDGREIVKMRLDVESLGSSDKVRVVFIAIRDDDEIKFIELFAKNEKQQREDQKRINKYLK
jgi:hypothetical protein